MSIQWLWVTGIRKTFSFLFCFFQFIPLIFTQPIVKDKSPVNTTHAGPEATTSKKEFRPCVANQNIDTKTYFSTRSSQIFSSHKIRWESNSLNHERICTFLFGSDRRQFLYRSAYTRFDLKLLSRSAESPKYLLAVWVVTSNMGMHIGQILSQYVQWMKTFWHPSAKTMHCKEIIIIPDE